MEDPIKEVADLMESTKEEGWEKSPSNKQVTFVVYREGDQLNFFRVVDRGDGTLTPLSESLRLNYFHYFCAAFKHNYYVACVPEYNAVHIKPNPSQGFAQISHC